MTKLEIHLPDPLGDFARARADAEKHADPSRYVQGLVEREQARLKELEELRARIRESKTSGVSPNKVPDIVERAEDEMRRDGLL